MKEAVGSKGLAQFVLNRFHMFLIIVDGLKSGIGSDPEGAICLIKFLAFVGVSGFYVLYRYFTFTIDSEAGDMSRALAILGDISLSCPMSPPPC